MRKRTFFILGVIWVISLFIVVCIKAEAQEILNLGATVPYQSRMGIQTKKILLMNADLLNKSGGLKIGGKTYTIKYHIYDDKYDADVGRAAFEKLVFENKIKYNVGTFVSGVVLSSLRITEPNKIPIFSGASAEKLRAPNIKYFVNTNPSQIFVPLIRAFHDIRPDVRKIALSTYDDEQGHTSGPFMEKCWKLFGMEPFSPIYIRHGEKDFSPIATKVVSLDPDHFVAGGINVEAEIIQLVKALRDAGYKKTIEVMFMGPKLLQEMAAKLGVEACNGIYCGIFDPTLPAIQSKPLGAEQFRINYEKYYGTWETEGIAWATSWDTWLTAVRKVDSLDPDRVLSALDKDFTVQTPLGSAKFFARRDLGNNRYINYATVVRLGISRNGKIDFVCEKDPDYYIDTMEKLLGAKLR